VNSIANESERSLLRRLGPVTCALDGRSRPATLLKNPDTRGGTTIQHRGRGAITGHCQRRRTIENRGKVDSDPPHSEAEEGIPYGRTRAALSKAGVHEAMVVLMYLGSTARFIKAG
jgi:hypothetical protein